MDVAYYRHNYLKGFTSQMQAFNRQMEWTASKLEKNQEQFLKCIP